MTQTQQAWLAEPETRHPLSDLDSATALLGHLPTGDSLAVLQKLTGWIVAVTELPGIPLQDQLDVLDLLDRTAKAHQLNLVPEYLDTPRMRKLSESRLWATSFEFWKEIGNAYLHCLERFQAAGADAKAFEPNLPLIVCRAIRSLTLQLKWTLLRYARIEERLWRDLGRAYLFAVSHGFSTQPGAIYPGSHGASSAQEELLKALMFSMAAPDALTPVQQHIAERIVAYYGSRFALHATPEPGCIFSFDLSMHMPPQRTRKDAAPAPLLCFFGPGAAIAGLHEMLGHLRQHGRLPPDTPIGGNFQAKEIKVVLKHLAHCWAASPTARRSRRRDLITRLTVVPGLVKSARWLEQMAATGPGAIVDPHAPESWVVVDANNGGYGAVVSAWPGDWLEIGALVCVTGETATESRMCILRRIAADAYGNHQVGMQLIGEVAVPVALFAAGAKHPADPRNPGEPAILISRQPDRRGAIELLRRSGSFLHNKTLLMRYRDRLLKLEQLQSIEQAGDYHWASFRLITAD